MGEYTFAEHSRVSVVVTYYYLDCLSDVLYSRITFNESCKVLNCAVQLMNK